MSSHEFKHTRLLTTSRHSWVGIEFSTEVEKMKWIDVPTHIHEFLTSVGTYSMTATKLAKKVVKSNMSVSDMDACLKWFVDHSGHCFTYYHDSKNHYNTRYRMSKKAFTHKSHNYYAKGLASTIQDNQFYVNTEVFGGGAINMDNATYTQWYTHVLNTLPSARLEFIAQQDEAKVNTSNSCVEQLKVFNELMTSKLADLNIHELLTETINSKFEEMLYYQWETHMLANTDDFVATLNENYITDTKEMAMDEKINMVSVNNTRVKQEGASVFTNILAIESAKEQALAGIASLAIPTQESEEE